MALEVSVWWEVTSGRHAHIPCKEETPLNLNLLHCTALSKPPCNADPCSTRRSSLYLGANTHQHRTIPPATAWQRAHLQPVDHGCCPTPHMPRAYALHMQIDCISCNGGG